MGWSLEFGKTFCCRGSLEVFACLEVFTRLEVFARLIRVRRVWYWPRDRDRQERETGGRIGR